MAHKKDFADVTRQITLIGGTTADMQLELGVTAEREEIVVTGAAGEIRTDEPQLGDRLGQKQLQEMPLLNSRITYLPLLNAANRPAINQGDVFMNENLFTTNGSGRRQTAWVVDGSTGNDSWGRQTILSNVPRDSVQEMTVLENAFSAEFGATNGRRGEHRDEIRKRCVSRRFVWPVAAERCGRETRGVHDGECDERQPDRDGFARANRRFVFRARSAPGTNVLRFFR